MPIMDLMNLTVDIDNVTIENLHLNSSNKLMVLGDDEATISIDDFEGHVLLNYSFITDPPLFADIGSFAFF